MPQPTSTVKCDDELLKMADKKANPIRKRSREELAFKLMGLIHHLERQSNPNPKDRKWILDLYAECLLTVRGDGNGGVERDLRGLLERFRAQFGRA